MAEKGYQECRGNNCNGDYLSLGLLLTLWPPTTWIIFGRKSEFF